MTCRSYRHCRSPCSASVVSSGTPGPRAGLDCSEAFGSQAAEEDPSGLGAFEFNHRLPGQLFDRETALHHNDHRDYRAHVGRYVESDPIGLSGGLNRYQYATGEPVNGTDPLGLSSSSAECVVARMLDALSETEQRLRVRKKSIDVDGIRRIVDSQQPLASINYMARTFFDAELLVLT